MLSFESLAKKIVAVSKIKIRVYLFGSQARKGGGESRSQDIDIVFELEEPFFEEYKERCQLAGLHYVCGVYDPLSMYWEYHSPKTLRNEAALETIGLAPEEIEGIFIEWRPNLIDELDIICLPRGWKEGEKYRDLDKEFSRRDPKFMENLAREAVLLS